MKLKNKETGEIKPAEAREDGIYLYDKTTEQWYKYGLSLLAECWEYYEEPKEYWYINELGKVEKAPSDWLCDERDSRKSIGNYFETKEEAEQAVEKLKAWKRLKDKGFINEQVFTMNLNWCNPDDDDWKAFHLLFGGEE